VPGRLGNRHPTIAPYETFEASDGEFILAVGNDDQWLKFCQAADLEPDDRFATNASRVTLHAELKSILDARLRRESRSYWIERLGSAGVPCGAVRDLQELFADPQLAAREMVLDVEHATLRRLRLLGTPLKLSETPASIRSAPPVLGQHTDRVLSADLGRSSEEIERLRAKGVV
jgi:crotonobetainyl-CoA:carnitine CoA-transferase CaiB-like acyl-CoA transferase